jgi:hypothetical protein
VFSFVGRIPVNRRGAPVGIMLLKGNAIIVVVLTANKLDDIVAM